MQTFSKILLVFFCLDETTVASQQKSLAELFVAGESSALPLVVHGSGLLGVPQKQEFPEDSRGR